MFKNMHHNIFSLWNYKEKKEMINTKFRIIASEGRGERWCGRGREHRGTEE